MGEPRNTLGVPWFPVVRHNNRDEETGTWMEALERPPAVVATGVDFAFQIMRGRHEHSLRERVGVPTSTKLLIHGQVRAAELDKLWKRRGEFLAWAKAEGVDGILTPQFTKADDDAPDLDRAFEWHREAAEEEFDYVVWQHPGPQKKDVVAECYDFVETEKVAIVAVAVGKDRGRGGLLPLTARDHKLCREKYPADVDFLHFGTSTALRMRMAAKLLGYFDGDRGVTFANVVAATGAAFYMRLPERATAPPDWTKGMVFAHNVAGYEKLAAKILTPAPPGKRKRKGRRRPLSSSRGVR